jgi:hypothetical protein
MPGAADNRYEVSDGALDKIEITDEMIDAGLKAWADYDSRFERPSSLVISIYQTMVLKAREPAACVRGFQAHTTSTPESSDSR